MINRRATAVWHGNGLEGKGTLTSTSGVLNKTPYSFATRFKSEDGKAGTNPEELIAAAHAGCFSMALSFTLAGAGFTPDALNTVATLRMDPQEGGGFAVAHITLTVKGQVPGITEEKFVELAELVKANCPISKALAAVPMTLEASLE